jgi:hypothetical protein
MRSNSGRKRPQFGALDSHGAAQSAKMQFIVHLIEQTQGVQANPDMLGADQVEAIRAAADLG